MENHYTALIVDADLSQSRGIALVLRDIFSEITLIQSPNEAIKLIQKNNYTITITDINFSVMDGLEVIKNFQKFAPETILFILSGHITETIKLQLSDLKIFRFIEKPINLFFLKQEIQKALNKKNNDKNNNIE